MSVNSRSTYHLIFLIASLFLEVASSQSASEQLSISPEAAESDSLLILTFPADGDTFSIGQVRFGAWTPDTSAKVTLQGNALKVYASGAVVGMFELLPGDNSAKFVVETDSLRFESTFHFYRIEPVVTLPAKPTQIIEKSIRPRHNQTYFSRQTIIVRAQGNPGGHAMFKIDHVTPGKMTMQELPPNETGGIRGIYEGVYEIQAGDACRNEPVQVWLTNPSGGFNKRTKENSSGRISVDLGPQPVVVATEGNSTLVYNIPGGEIIMDLPANIKLVTLAQLGGWYKIELSDGQIAYTASSGVTRQPMGRGVPKASLRNIAAREDSSWLTLTFALSGRVPYRIAQGANPQRLSLYFHRTSMVSEWTRYPETWDMIDHYDWQQIGEELLRFDIYLKGEQQWGYKASYTDEAFELGLRIPPVITKKRPFANLIIALDAGHGGEHKGSKGATGLLEKSVNLDYTLNLADMLRDAGAEVVLTRSIDTTMFLAQRVKLAREAGAHILVWMHNNSTGLSRPPLAVQGTSTFYTNIQGLPFSQALYPHMLALGLEPQGIVHRSYYVTRQTDPVIYLVEGAFLSHPEDEMFMLEKENLRRMAEAVYNGLHDRLLDLAQ